MMVLLQIRRETFGPVHAVNTGAGEGGEGRGQKKGNTNPRDLKEAVQIHLVAEIK